MLINEKLLSSSLKITTRAIVKRAIERGFQVIGFETNKAILQLKDSQGNNFFLFSASPPQTSYPVSKILKDKRITAQILKSEGFSVPDELLVYARTYTKDLAAISTFLERHKRVVLKPLDGAHGRGINADIRSLDDVKHYIAHREPGSNKLLLQEFIEGEDLRIVVVGYKYANAITRVPATISGDGVHTVSELIAIENKREVRSDGYKTNLTTISVPRAQRFLKYKINTIPAKGEEMCVVDIANVGVGGTRINVTHKIPVWLKDEAEKISRQLQAPVCGIDFIVKGILESSTQKKDVVYRVIEVNSCPGLVQYEDVSAKEQIRLIDQYIDFATQQCAGDAKSNIE